MLFRASLVVFILFYSRAMSQRDVNLFAYNTNQHPTADYCCCMSRANAQCSSNTVRPGPRIVNVFQPPRPQQHAVCPPSEVRCCYGSREAFEAVGRHCSRFDTPPDTPTWRELACPERNQIGPPRRTILVPRQRQRVCGERDSFRVAPNLPHGFASPGEFPWACLVVDASGKPISSCVIIPAKFDNDITGNTNKVLTVAHKVSNVNRNLRVRVLEYDLSGNPSIFERDRYVEYPVRSVHINPQFNDVRYDHNLAVLLLDEYIDITSSSSPGVGAACLPQCRDMFGFQFTNRTGTRCWVSGWGLPRLGRLRKVDVPLVDSRHCERNLRAVIETSSPFHGPIHASEICAGGEKNKDACNGDGGSPLVCQSEQGLWHVVGLVGWGVNCGLKDVPGVYTEITNFRDFIESIG